MFEEIPVVIKNSHLVNALLCEIEEQMPEQEKFNFLDLATGCVSLCCCVWSLFVTHSHGSTVVSHCIHYCAVLAALFDFFAT